MGRWKRKKRQYNSKRLSDVSTQSTKSDASSSFLGGESREALGDDVGQTKSFDIKDRKLLLRYLQAYKRGAWEVYSEGESNGSFVSKRSGTPLVIGGHVFPSLTKEVLRQPYVQLPRELSSKQRRAVHEICSDGECLSCDWFAYQLRYA